MSNLIPTVPPDLAEIVLWLHIFYLLDCVFQRHIQPKRYHVFVWNTSNWQYFGNFIHTQSIHKSPKTLANVLVIRCLTEDSYHLLCY